MWPLRILASRLRPWNVAAVARLAIVATVFSTFLCGDFVLFRRLFEAISKVEAATPIFAIGLLRNILSLVFLVATVVLFSSAMTTAIGALLTDLDLETYHAAPRGRLRIAIARLGKTLVQSATIVYVFLLPLLAAFGVRYHIAPGPLAWIAFLLAVALTIPVTLAATLILALVRFFPVRRIHQIVTSIAIVVLSLAVIAFRMSRPERFFAPVLSDDVVQVLHQLELPSMRLYPTTAVAEGLTALAGHRQFPLTPISIFVPALVALALFVAAANAWYFVAWVRARESMAPAALGSDAATRLFDRLLAHADPHTRALIGKEARILSRDVAQWSQVFLTASLVVVYLYNIRLLPLTGDARATIVAYANLGMSGFVIAAVCLRFAYPSISAEGKAFWIVQSAPVSPRRLLLAKLTVYALPLTALSLGLTVLANAVLAAAPVVWILTLLGALLVPVTLVSLGVAMGAFWPDFQAENPIQVGLSLGGFAYMGIALLYVGAIMLLTARPIIVYLMWRVIGLESRGTASFLIPLVTAVTLSLLLSVFPLRIAERRLAGLRRS